MKFLVTGSTGLIGSQVVQDLILEHQVYSCYHDAKPKYGIPIWLDLANQDNTVNVLADIKPDAIIHLAAITDVDLCETKQELAMKINADATKTLATYATKNNAFFVYVSTDYVFDGKKGTYRETDLPNALGFYGKSKLEGEKQIQKLDSTTWCIARTSTPFGLHQIKKSFPVWVKENLQGNKPVNVLTDQYTSPTYVPNLSRMLIEIATRQITGIIHVSGATRISRFDFAKLVCNKLHLDEGLLKPTLLDSMIWKAKRPKDSSLDVTKAMSTLKEKPQTIQESMNFFVNSIQDN